MEEIHRMQDNLLLIRRTVGWTAEEFGDQIGVTRQTINNIESGRNKLTKTQYIAMRSVIEAEMAKHPDETQMLRVLLDMLVDHPENYSKEDYESLLEKANMMSPSILAGTSTRENVSKEWMKAAGTVGAIAAVVAGAAALPIAGVPLAGAIIGGLDYIYVDHGNDVGELIEAFQSVKDSKKPVVVHINTLKGKGYAPAEQNKEVWHYNGPFHIETGEPLYEMTEEDYSDISMNYLLDKMKKDPAVVAITSGTPTVMGFTEDKRKEAGKQFVDVGIAEETAVALASGIAANGGKPVYGVYSTFVQRTYDQIAQDLCINNSPATIVTFCGSVYGMNDVTHLGLYDIPMMANIPNLVYLAPTTKEEYLAMLDWSIEQNEYPVGIRLPGGSVISDGKEITKDFGDLNKYEVTQKGSRAAVIGLGTFYGLGKEVAEELKKVTGTDATVINPYYITGIDAELLEELKKDHDVVITLEDGILDGGFGEKIARFYGDSDMKVLNFGLKKEFLDRYDVAEVLKENHLTKEQIMEGIMKFI